MIYSKKLIYAKDSIDNHAGEVMAHKLKIKNFDSEKQSTPKLNIQSMVNQLDDL